MRASDDASPGLTPEAMEAVPWWRIGRASLGFILDMIAIGRGDGSLVDPLILATVIDANLAVIAKDPELQLRYSALDAPPPDEVRRPVSISAVAGSIRLPYETVRRRIAKLAEQGACKITPRGVVVPTATLNTPAYAEQAIARYERLKRFYFELKGLGALSAMAWPNDPPAIEAPPVRAVNRLMSEYFLRVVDSIMRNIADPLTGLILMEMARANTEHLTREERDVEAPVDDEVRRPIRTHTLATRLGLPSETVRRHVARLEKLGFVRKAGAGRLAALEKLGQGPTGANALAENLMNVHRLFTRLANHGVLAYWDAEAERG
jgi:Mn-dependent DtxR family transcriptional regulator